MKKFRMILLAVLLILCLTACGTSKSADINTENDIINTEIDIYEKEENDNDVENSSSQVTSSIFDKTQIPSSKVETSSTVSPDFSIESSESMSNASDTSTSSADITVDYSIINESSKEESSNAEHIHSFTTATCTEPSKCVCGEIKGNALGHSYSDATCTSAKICTYCGISEGIALGHILVDGVCSRCGFTDTQNVETQIDNTEISDNDMVWIPTKGGKKYHKNSDCSNMIDPQNVTKSEAENQGFTACKRCYK